MTPAKAHALRIVFGSAVSVAISHAFGWPLFYLAPLFAAMFLGIPGPWIGWKKAMNILGRHAAALLIGLVISEVFLRMPLACILVYGLVFFCIYYAAPTAPPFATIFMSMSVTLVPIMGLQGAVLAHHVAFFSFVNVALGAVLAGAFHVFIPNPPAEQDPDAPPAPPPEPPPIPPREQRLRNALVSTLVSTTAVIIFFSFNLISYALSMVYICIMAGTPSSNANVKMIKANAMACLIGGVTVLFAYNLLLAVPEFEFLILVTLVFSFFFARKITSGKPTSGMWLSGYYTFLILLGKSTEVNTGADSQFYMRTVEILCAGISSLLGIVFFEYILNRWSRRKRWLFGRKNPAESPAP